MNAYLIDTNVLLRYLLGDIATQTITARKYFQQANDKTITIAIPLLVFVETFFALTKLYHLPPTDVSETLLNIAQISYLDIENRDVLVKACAFYGKTTASFVDLLLLFEARSNNKTLLTFDKKLAAIHF